MDTTNHCPRCEQYAAERDAARAELERQKLRYVPREGFDLECLRDAERMNALEGDRWLTRIDVAHGNEAIYMDCPLPNDLNGKRFKYFRDYADALLAEEKQAQEVTK